jgi:hypothetical protein
MDQTSKSFMLRQSMKMRGGSPTNKNKGSAIK